MVVGYTPCLVPIFPGLLSIAQEISAQVREICHPEGGHSATGRWSRRLLDGGWGGALTFCWNQLFCNIYIYSSSYIHIMIYIYIIYIYMYISYIYIYTPYIYIFKQTTKLRWQTHVSSRFGMMITNCGMFFTTNELMDNYWRSVENHHWTGPQTTAIFWMCRSCPFGVHKASGSISKSAISQSYLNFFGQESPSYWLCWTTLFGLSFLIQKSSKIGAWGSFFTLGLWTQYLHREWAVHQTHHPFPWQDELGPDAQPGGFGLRYVHQPCVAWRNLRISEESAAQLATRSGITVVVVDVICWGLENQQLKHQGHANWTMKNMGWDDLGDNISHLFGRSWWFLIWTGLQLPNWWFDWRGLSHSWNPIPSYSIPCLKTSFPQL